MVYLFYNESLLSTGSFIDKIIIYSILLYRHECFTGKYTTRKILHPGPEWFISHNLTREFIDNVISVIFRRNL